MPARIACLFTADVTHPAAAGPKMKRLLTVKLFRQTPHLLRQVIMPFSGLHHSFKIVAVFQRSHCLVNKGETIILQSAHEGFHLSHIGRAHVTPAVIAAGVGFAQLAEGSIRLNPFRLNKFRPVSSQAQHFFSQCFFFHSSPAVCRFP